MGKVVKIKKAPSKKKIDEWSEDDDPEVQCFPSIWLLVLFLYYTTFIDFRQVNQHKSKEQEDQKQKAIKKLIKSQLKES